LLANGSSDSLVISPAILAELAEVLGRQKFAGRLTAAQRRRFALRIYATAHGVEHGEQVRDCRDPADNMVLEAALAAMQGQGTTVVIVSDDHDLLTMDPWRGIRIVKPEAALAMIEAGQV
jgi:putative PIN family toxin of toxin-antitoxin system